jgi:hypothetical protein
MQTLNRLQQGSGEAALICGDLFSGVAQRRLKFPRHRCQAFQWFRLPSTAMYNCACFIDVILKNLSMSEGNTREETII